MSFAGKRTVGCVTYLERDRTEEPMWTADTPLVIERIFWDEDARIRGYWVSDKRANIRVVHDADLADPYGYYRNG